MGTSILKRAGKFLQERSRHKHWQIAMALLGILVVGATVYTLLMPALTMERKSYCGLEEHVHTEECYIDTTASVEEQGTKMLNCLEQIHSHTEDCYDDEDELICGYADFAVHTHTDECYGENGNLICPLEEIEVHEHTDECYETVEHGLICEEEEREAHTHSDECYTMTEELTCEKEEGEGHEHDDSCYTVTEDKKLTCGQDESEGHTHDDSCYTETEELTCGQDESAGHSHGGGCYEEVLDCDEDHEHDDGCYKEELVCDEDESEGHSHGSDCYTTSKELTCGQDESKGHEHDEDCYTIEELKELTCGKEESESHTHSEDCYEEVKGLTCGKEESEGHEHDDDCYGETEELICEEDEVILHEHDEDCYDEDGNRICGMLEVKEHIHDENCFAGIEDETQEPVLSEVPLCGLEEHTHVEECYVDPEAPANMEELEEEFAMLSEEDRARVEHVRELIAALPSQEDIEAAFDAYEEAEDEEGYTAYYLELKEQVEEAYKAYEELGELQKFIDTESVEYLTALFELFGAEVLDQVDSLPVADYLKSATILINGEPYNGTDMLNPGEQFEVQLEWELTRAELERTKTYTYTFPKQIDIKDVDNVILYDDNNVKKGVYSVKDGKLTVIYDNVSDLNQTKFKLKASWSENRGGTDTVIQWNDTLTTPVKFNDSPIAATKERVKEVTLDNGSLVWIYAVQVKATEDAAGIILTDEMQADKFVFYPEYFDGHDYKITIGNAASELKDFQSTEGINDPTTTSGVSKVTFEPFDLKKDETCTIEYAVILDCDKRADLDDWQEATTLTNTAKAVYKKGDDEYSSTVAIKDTYWSEEKWVVKEHGNLTPEDIQAKKDVPWTIRINTAKNYNMGGSVVADEINTEGVIYKTGEPMKITATDADGNVAGEKELKWIELPDEYINALWAESAESAISKYKWALAEYLKIPVDSINTNNITDYAFVGQSSRKFAWFAPDYGKNVSYTLQYTTDISNMNTNVLNNSALVNWQGRVSGDMPGEFLQEVELEKENTGGRWDDKGNFLVDWTITLKVEPERDAIPNVFLYDQLPIYYNCTAAGGNAADWLEGLNGPLDYAKTTSEDDAARIQYLNDFTKGAIKVSTTSTDPEVLKIVNQATTSLGHPVKTPEGADFIACDVTETDAQLNGQLELINVTKPEYEGKRVTASRFGVALGTLPSTRGKDGYEIKITYTTRLNPAVASTLDGKASANNIVQIRQWIKNSMGTSEVTLGEAEAPYHVERFLAENALAKDVVNYDPANRILTYRVSLNPDGELDTIDGATYMVADFIEIPAGAKFIENSFRLWTPATVEHYKVDENNGFYAFKQNKSLKTVLWSSDGKWEAGSTGYTYVSDDGYDTILGSEEYAYMQKHISCQVNNSKDSGNDFVLSITNEWNVFHINEPKELDGKFPTMFLEYQVQLPELSSTEVEEGNEAKIINSASFSVSLGEDMTKNLGNADTSFDYSSALHKLLTTKPDKDNAYQASFKIEVNKNTTSWKKTDYFTVQDTLSNSLKVDVDSVKVYGIREDGTSSVLVPAEGAGDTWEGAGNYVVSYSEVDVEETSHFLTVRVKDSSEYVRYFIEYDTHVQGDKNTIVQYSNVAEIEGMGIKSEKIETSVNLQEQSANVVETNFKITIKKRSSVGSQPLSGVTFDLYTYNDGKWSLKKNDLSTGDNGNLTLDNNSGDSMLLQVDTWYALVETKAPEGYLKNTTYFYLSKTGELADGATVPLKVGETDDETEKVEKYNKVKVEGGDLQILNYKATLKIRKIESEKPTLGLQGAEFNLYTDPECKDANLSIEMISDAAGNCTVDLSQLTPGVKYYLKETKAPNGYHLSDTIYILTFDNEGKVTLKNGEEIVDVMNQAYLIPNELGYVLPETGGIGMSLYTIASALMVLGAGFMYNKKFRKGGKSSSRN